MKIIHEKKKSKQFDNFFPLYLKVYLELNELEFNYAFK